MLKIIQNAPTAAKIVSIKSLYGIILDAENTVLIARRNVPEYKNKFDSFFILSEKEASCVPPDAPAGGR